jgi:hypothetical protein
VPARLRRGVEQQVDAIAGSASKVLGVVDQGFGVLRALLPGTSADAHAASSENPNADQEIAPWNAGRPGFGLLRRESAFSIASLAASLPGGRDRARSLASTTGTTAEELGQMMVDVSSRPGSVRSVYGSDAESSADDDSQDDDEYDDEQERDDDRHDTRSIRSFENMMGRATRRRRPRKSLSDRLASMPGLARHSGPPQAIQQLVVHMFLLLRSQDWSLINFFFRVRHRPCDFHRFFLPPEPRLPPQTAKRHLYRVEHRHPYLCALPLQINAFWRQLQMTSGCPKSRSFCTNTRGLLRAYVQWEGLKSDLVIVVLSKCCVKTK